MQYDFRPIGRGDFDAMDEIYLPYAGHGFPRYRLEPSLADYPSVIAEKGGRVVGFAYTLGFAPDIAELGNIYLAPECRGANAGGRMLRFIEDRLAEPLRYIIAVNSRIRKVRGEKPDPTAFYARNGYAILQKTEASTIFWKEVRPAGG